MDVSIILVNYFTSDLLKNTIQSIFEKSHDFSYEIVIVDNSNNKIEFDKLTDLIHKLQESHSESINIQTIQAESNLGFGKANNLGARIANGKYLFFLNSDTLLVNNAIYELFEFMEKNQQTGVAGANLYSIDMIPVHSFVKKEKTPESTLKNNTFAHFLKRLIQAKQDDFNYTNTPLSIKGHICGASLMIRKSDFASLNGFDQDIFMYSEDTLLCYQVVHQLNKQLMNIPSAKIIHLEGASFNNKKNKNDSSITGTRLKRMLEGDYIYYSKCFGTTRALNYLKGMEKSFIKKERLCKLLGLKSKAKVFKDSADIFHSAVIEKQDPSSNTKQDL